MNLFLSIVSSFLLTISIFAENPIQTQIYEIVPLHDGNTIIIVNDEAKTAFMSINPLLNEWQMGQFITMDDPYKTSTDIIVLNNESVDTQIEAKRMGGLCKDSGETIITSIDDRGDDVLLSLSGKYDDTIRIYLKNKSQFLNDFHEGDIVYQFQCPHNDWPNFKDFLKVGGAGDVSWSNVEDFLLNPATGVYSEYFYPWDPY